MIGTTVSGQASQCHDGVSRDLLVPIATEYAVFAYTCHAVSIVAVYKRITSTHVTFVGIPLGLSVTYCCFAASHWHLSFVRRIGLAPARLHREVFHCNTPLVPWFNYIRVN